MRHGSGLPAILGLGVALSTAVSAAEAGEQAIAHTVYFTLARDTKATRAVLIAACREHLSDHEGILRFSVASRASEPGEGDEDTDFDVELRIVFRSQADLQRFREDRRRKAFEKDYAELWVRRRIFNSVLDSEPSPGEPVEDPVIRERILRLASRGESRENAIKELVAAGEPALRQLLAFMARTSGADSFARDPELTSYSGASRAVLGIVGPAAAVERLLEHGQILSTTALDELKKRIDEAPPETRTRIEDSVAKARKADRASRRILALQLELAFGDATAALREFEREIENGEKSYEAGHAFLEADGAYSGVNSRLIELYGVVLRRPNPQLMERTIDHLRDYYDFGFEREREERRFAPVFPQLFVAYLHVRDEFAWVGEMYFLEAMLLRGLHDRWSEYAPEAILLSDSNTLKARGTLVRLFAQALGRYELDDFWNPHELKRFERSRITETVKSVLAKSGDDELRKLILEHFPELERKRQAF